MELSNDQSKMDIVARLVKEGAIDFNEAIKLMQKDIEYISFPHPYQPLPPWNPYPIIPYPQTIPNIGVLTTGGNLIVPNGNELFTYTNN